MKSVQQQWFVILAIIFMLCLTGLVISGTAFAERCVDNDDGTITDNNTGLMWQKATAGSMDWNQAMSYASGLSLGEYGGWGLPTSDELVGLYHSPCKNNMDVQDSYYWSSTLDGFNTNVAWNVYFRYGDVYGTGKHKKLFVRAVRSAQ